MPLTSVIETTTYGVTAPGRPGRPATSAGTGAAFSVPGSPTPAGPVRSANAATAADGLLAMQEQAWESVRDRAARRQGKHMLEALTAFQAALLGGGWPDLDTLTRLVAVSGGADDPRLDSVLAGIRLRARIEIARH